MKRKRILITGAGGTPAINFIRSLRLAPESFYIIGVDADEYCLQRAETEEKYLIPLAKQPEYVPVLKDIIAQTKPDFLYTQTDQETGKIAPIQQELGVKTFLPDPRTIRICHDKYLSYQAWKNAGVPVPETMLITNTKDLKKSFQLFGSPLWLRATYSSGGGMGSFKAKNMKEATMWIELQEGWGTFTAAECLSPKSTTWASIWKDGELIVAQGRERLYWEFANRAPSGVTGITGTGLTVRDKKIDELAIKAIKAIDHKPNGIFSVDFTYDKNKNLRLTEINIGRLFTTIFFFSKAGINLPYIYVKLAFNESIEGLVPQKINPLKPGLLWVRGMDILPVLSDLKTVEKSKEELEKRVVKIKQKSAE